MQRCEWISKNILSKRRQIQKSTHCRIPFRWNSGKVKTNLQWQEAGQQLPGGMWKIDCEGHEGTLEGYSNVLYFDYSGGYTSANICQNSLSCIVLYILLYINYTAIKLIKTF